MVLVSRSLYVPRTSSSVRESCTEASIGNFVARAHALLDSISCLSIIREERESEIWNLKSKIDRSEPTSQTRIFSGQDFVDISDAATTPNWTDLWFRKKEKKESILVQNRP